MKEDSLASDRHKMVEQQLIWRGIADECVLEAMRTVPRHLFISREWENDAYADNPLPIGEGQTISQPFMVALMTQEALLEPTSRVLEIGTGSGYAAAVASLCAQEVYTIERLPLLAQRAEYKLRELGYSNVAVHLGDGSLGWPEKGPFDAIIVTAGAPVVPQALFDQLAVGGRLIIPVGRGDAQELKRITKGDQKEKREEFLELVRFVPLIGEQGWLE